MRLPSVRSSWKIWPSPSLSFKARAQEHYAAEKAEYETKLREREDKARHNVRKPSGCQPKPPEPDPQNKDQYNFTDPDSYIIKNSTYGGFDKHCNIQAAMEWESLLIVATSFSNHSNENQEAEPTLYAISS